MKELDPVLEPAKDILQVNAEAPVRKNEIFGQLHPHKGHRVWELNRRTGEVSQATIEETAIINLDGKVTNNKRVKVKPGYLYLSALNKKSAIKHFIKLMQDTITHTQKQTA